MPQRRAAACSSAPAGSYAPGGGTMAISCPAGTFSATAGAAACSSAPAGSYDPGTGNTAAISCPANTSDTGTGNTFCTAATSLTYTGPDQVGIGSSLVPTATLSSLVTMCESVQPVTFSLSLDPLNGAAGPYALETVNSTTGGAVTGTAISTTGWENGVYGITASYAGTTTGTTQCAPVSTMATLAVTSPGQFALGSGWYTPVASVGTTSFGFVVTHSKSSYQGELSVVTPGKWWFQANVTSFGLTGTTQALLGGAGSLYWWNTTLNKGHGGWQLAQSGVTYKAIANTATKSTAASFGITLTYTPGPGQPTVLPNSSPVALAKGGITIT